MIGWTRTVAFRLAFAVCCTSVALGPARAEDSLVADLSSELVGISSSFTGTELILFGAIERDPFELLESLDRTGRRSDAVAQSQRGDIIVVVRGPAEEATVRRKARVGLIWMNVDAVVFPNAPSFYFVATTRPLDDIASPNLLRREEFGAGNLHFAAAPADTARGEDVLTHYRSALVRNKVRDGLYEEHIGGVRFSGNTLFRATLPIPANVPVGNYRAEVYLIRDGFIVNAQSWPFFVAKTGLERWLYQQAHANPILYGLGAIILAVAAGLAASIAFRHSS